MRCRSTLRAGVASRVDAVFRSAAIVVEPEAEGVVVSILKSVVSHPKGSESVWSWSQFDALSGFVRSRGRRLHGTSRLLLRFPELGVVCT